MGHFIENIYEQLRRHPKRILYPEGNNPRILEAAREYIDRKLGVTVLLGDRDEIHAVAEKHGIDLKRMMLIDPANAADLPLFIRRLETLNRYKGIKNQEAERILKNPNYFGAMMLQNGQCDGLVAGAGQYSGNILRPLFQLIKPLPHIKTISSCMILDIPDCPFGDQGVLFFADAGVVPNPTVEQLSEIAMETAWLRRQLSGKMPRVAFLSYSTKGSAITPGTEKIVAGIALTRQKLEQHGIDAKVDGELQVDAALIPEIAQLKASGSEVAGQADVLIFPDLNSGNISAKLVQLLSGATAYGQVLLGLSKPAAELSRGAKTEDVVGVSALVAIQAIEYRKLYPDAN